MYNIVRLQNILPWGVEGLTPDIGRKKKHEEGWGEDGFGAHGVLYKRAAM